MALIATGLGATGLGGYETPAGRIREWLEERPDNPADRRDRVAAFVAATGGEVS